MTDREPNAKCDGAKWLEQTRQEPSKSSVSFALDGVLRQFLGQHGETQSLAAVRVWLQEQHTHFAEIERRWHPLAPAWLALPLP